MGSDAPSWADQWGSGGIGAMGGEDDNNKTHKLEEKKKGSGGLSKAKAAAVAGANKVKTGTTSGFKWVKSLSQKKPSSSSAK